MGVQGENYYATSETGQREIISFSYQEFGDSEFSSFFEIWHFCDFSSHLEVSEVLTFTSRETTYKFATSQNLEPQLIYSENSQTLGTYRALGTT